MAYGKRFRGFAAHHLLNLVLTVGTVGLWAMVLQIMYRVGRAGEQTVALSVDEHAEVVRRPVVWPARRSTQSPPKEGDRNT